MKKKLAYIICSVAILGIVFYSGYEAGKPPQKTEVDYELEQEELNSYYDAGYDDGIYDSYDLVYSLFNNSKKEGIFLDEPCLFNDGIGRVLYDNLDDNTAEKILEKMMDYTADTSFMINETTFEDKVKKLKEVSIKDEDTDDWYEIAEENAEKADQEYRDKLDEQLHNNESE